MKLIILFITTLLFFTACKKPKIEPEIPGQFSNGIICLNEGLFQQNNSTLSYFSIDSNKVINSVFSNINGRALGDTGNDMIKFNYNDTNYIAIAIDVSSQIEILNAMTLKSVKQISLFENNNGLSPRSLAYNNGYLYVITYSGDVKVISMENFLIIKSIPLKLNPENNVIHGDKLYVVNTGGLNYPIYDSTLSIIDLNTNTVLDELEIGINSSTCIVDDNSEMYVLSRGNYSDILPKILHFDLTDNSLISTIELPITIMVYSDAILYLYNEVTNGIYTYNTNTETISNNPLINCENIETVYGIHINRNTNEIFIVDAKGYTNSSVVNVYSSNGIYKHQFTTALNTGNLIFNY